jgi:hypothetical protein
LTAVGRLVCHSVGGGSDEDGDDDDDKSAKRLRLLADTSLAQCLPSPSDSLEAHECAEDFEDSDEADASGSARDDAWGSGRSNAWGSGSGGPERSPDAAGSRSSLRVSAMRTASDGMLHLRTPRIRPQQQVGCGLEFGFFSGFRGYGFRVKPGLESGVHSQGCL